MFEHNHTPLTHTPLNVQAMHKKKPNPHTLLNVALIIALGVFAVTAGIFMKSSFQTTSGYAQEPAPVQEVIIKRSILDGYNGEPILPAHKNLLLAVHDKEEEYKQREAIIKKYYIYKDIVAKTGVDPTASVSANTILDIQQATAILEPLVIANTLTTRKLAYIYVYSYDPSLSTEENATRDVEGRLLLTEYQKLFEKKTYTIKQLIDIAQKDEKLAQYRFQEANAGIIEHYNRGYGLFPQDVTIDDTVFSLEKDSLSPITVIKDTAKGNALGYALFYLLDENQGSYSIIDNVITEAEGRFTFN